MKIEELTISEHHLAALDAFGASFSPSEVLQSSHWLKFQQTLGQVVRLFSWQDETATGYFLAIATKLPLGRCYYYLPRGPITNDETIWPKLLSALAAYFKTVAPQTVFVRLEPSNSFPGFKDCRRVLDIQPSHSFQTDLTKEEAEILAAMHPKTRYNIKLALKKGLRLAFTDPSIKEFLQLISETAQRDKFKTHSPEYYKTMLETGAVKLATVRDDEGILAAALYAEFGQTFAYLHGASADRRRETMAPYALHWEMMMKAKADNKEIYDWHGVDKDKWPGVTRFKRGFGGHEFIYPGTFDLVIDKKNYVGYTILRSFARLRRIIRGFGG